jgi:hypothetical protein
MAKNRGIPTAPKRPAPKLTIKQRRDRKRIANDKLSFAFVAMRDVDDLLKFNKRLSEAAKEIKYRICLLAEKLEK